MCKVGTGGGAVSLFKSHFGVDLDEFRQLPRDRAAALVRESFPDLLHWLGRRAGAEKRERPRVLKLALGLEQALAQTLHPDPRQLQDLGDRIIVDGFTRAEYDRDQNVYLGRTFTRRLTRSIPELVFLPRTHHELEVALAWAESAGVGVTTRGAGSTAMGGGVANDGGLLFDMSRFDQIQIDRAAGMAVIGAGARFKHIHRELAQSGFALPVYPSNLGGTLGGWFSAGGLGLNSFKHGFLHNHVRSLSVLLPRGQHVRFHDDGRLDVLGPGEPSNRLSPEQAAEWLRAARYPRLRLADLARSEGQFGVILTLTIALVPLPRFNSFFYEFDSDAEAMQFVHWLAETADSRRAVPANLKYLSQEHVEAVRRVRNDTRPPRPAAYVDFDDAGEAARFEAGLEAGQWRARNDAVEAQRWYADRFRPQQTKRLGPGFLAAEILLPAHHVEPFLQRARELAAKVGIHLESEVYFLRDGRALALPGYLSRGPRFGFLFELVFAPMLVELAMSEYDGEPYVLGRWQAAFFRARFRAGEARTLQRAKRVADPDWRLNPGVYFRPVFRVRGLGTVFLLTFARNLALLRRLYASRAFAPLFRAFITRGAQAAPRRPSADPAADASAIAAAAELEALATHARGCVNCGECNSVCPVFHDASIRLPQMLTHIAEKLRSATPLAGTPQLLLDLCMRCGNCEEVCQAEIPHLAMYARMESHSGAWDADRSERHLGILAHLRSSPEYGRDFLGLRPGGYLTRTPASLTGDVRYLLFRAENDAGPASTCIHCGACVPVCPTAANQEYADATDLRRITTDLARCIGCGTCVEVCPANLVNGGRTLRVMEAPGREFFAACAALEHQEEGSEV